MFLDILLLACTCGYPIILCIFFV